MKLCQSFAILKHEKFLISHDTEKEEFDKLLMSGFVVRQFCKSIRLCQEKHLRESVSLKKTAPVEEES